MNNAHALKVKYQTREQKFCKKMICFFFNINTDFWTLNIKNKLV